MRFFARTVFFAYLLLAIFAVALVFLDPPSGRGWSGVILFVVSLVVGLPWSAVLWGLTRQFLLSTEVTVALCFVGIAINLGLVTRWAFRGSLPTVTAALSGPWPWTRRLANAVVRPIALGVVASFASFAGVGFLALNVPAVKQSFWLLTAGLAVPLLVAGYVGARFTVSAFRARKVSLGVASALLGYAPTYFFVPGPIEAWMLIFLVLAPAIVAAVGAWLGAIATPSKALVGRTPDT